MKNRKLIFKIGFSFLLLILVISIQSFNNYNLKLGTKLALIINYQDSQEKNLVWIYFTDKGKNTETKLSHPKNFLTEKSIERRLKRINSENIVEYSDIPLNYDYIKEIKDLGIKVKNKSKWFNCVSCYSNKIQIENIIQKDFVKKVELVERYIRKNELLNYNFENNKNFTNNNFQTDNISSINYGPSFDQSNIINVPTVHENGYTGRGILIASFDAGFDNLQHPCFNSMIARGIRTYDFVNGDTIVANGTGRMGNGAHGTLTLSLVAAYAPGSLVSPAFDSKFILAKTENTDSETPLEEDNWIAAAEWADSLGADIITSSLGYLNFDPPYPSYTWQSMDGNTALITRCADLSVHKGIIVVSSAGNNGYNPEHNTLDAPADGDSVITVGSVNINKQRSSFSSVGPTIDGRIKPDVMALGAGNYCARFGAGNTEYTNTSSGTSLSCPMVAGVCALILSANQNLTPIQVRDILRSTADSNQIPNNFRGWGIVNAWSAVQKALNLNNPIVSDYQLEQNFPNPFNPTTTFNFALRKGADISLIIYDVSGKAIAKVLDNVFYTTGSKQVKFNFSNIGLSSGVYFYSLLANGQFIDSKKMVFVK